jgi:hypothetical protein
VSKFVHVGHVSFNAHPASPLVIGDFEVMKGWQGDEDGAYAGEEIELEGGKVVCTDLELMAPDVFFAAPDRIVMLAESNRSMMKSHELADLQADLDAPIDGHESWAIDVRSGAIVISIAYNPTPEEGSDTEHLDDWDPDEAPMLPKKVPSKPLWTDKRAQRDLAVIPVPPGKYTITVGQGERFQRCDITPAGTAKGAKAKPAAKVKPAANAAKAKKPAAKAKKPAAKARKPAAKAKATPAKRKPAKKKR